MSRRRTHVPFERDNLVFLVYLLLGSGWGATERTLEALYSEVESKEPVYISQNPAGLEKIRGGMELIQDVGLQALGQDPLHVPGPWPVARPVQDVDRQPGPEVGRARTEYG